MIAGQLIRLKEKHLLSHAAINEVVEFVKTVCDSIMGKTLNSLSSCAEESGLLHFIKICLNCWRVL